ncbi:MAG: hypothetical protein KAQ63_03410, partial [Candidatus Moranbacteria bacterium]|nr:hypothetical protein [Candidatus Moranbacteria bacterium]
NNQVVFSAIHNPMTNETYTAYKNKGAFLNKKRITFEKNEDAKILFMPTSHLREIDKKVETEMFNELSCFSLYRNANSHAVSFCHVAKGIYDGLVCFSKDSFPVFAGSLIIQEAGEIFTNLEGESEINYRNRIFIAGHKEIYDKLKKLTEKVVNNNKINLEKNGYLK